MNRGFLTAAAALLVTLSAQGQHIAESYRLKRVIAVEGRQGIAADSNYYYVSGSTVLYKYDKSGRLVASNDKPFEGLPLAANHLGDIDVHGGEIFAGIEHFEDGRGRNIQIAVYDAATLRWKRSMPWSAQSGQVEVCGLTVDRERGKVWMADWVDGRYLYRYDLVSGEYEGKVHLRPVPQYQQGIFYADGKIIISADDGDADLHETDNLYICDVTDPGRTSTLVTHFREMKEFKRAGEIEGLCIDPATGDLLVLTNRGSRIVLGMVRGFYPGYDREIHELYIFEPLADGYSIRQQVSREILKTYQVIQEAATRRVAILGSTRHRRSPAAAQDEF